MKRGTKRALVVAVGEVLMAGILLLTFAFFHHVLPRMRAPKTPVSTVNVAVTPPIPSTTPSSSTPCSTPGRSTTSLPSSRLTWRNED